MRFETMALQRFVAAVTGENMKVQAPNNNFPERHFPLKWNKMDPKKRQRRKSLYRLI